MVLLLIGSNARELDLCEAALERRGISALAGTWTNRWDDFEAVVDVSCMTALELDRKLTAYQLARAH